MLIVEEIKLLITNHWLEQTLHKFLQSNLSFQNQLFFVQNVQTLTRTITIILKALDKVLLSEKQKNEIAISILATLQGQLIQNE